ncbi:MAG: ureidoglycolate lyase [Cyanobacteria bacterium P01_G01_bin.19]
MPKLLTRQPIRAVAIDESNFKPYGQLISASADGKMFDDTDAVINLQNGIPRFYIMQLHYRGRVFNDITRHNLCTQCLGSLNGHDWFIAVCPPSNEPKPDLSLMKVFRIPGDCFIKMEVGTWHAGPYFDREVVNFYNLELSDTNVIDRFTYNFATKQNLEFEIVD